MEKRCILLLRVFGWSGFVLSSMLSIQAQTTTPTTTHKAAPKPPAKAAPQLGPADTPTDIERQYQERIVKDRLDGVYIPKNLDEAMVELDKKIGPDMQAKIRAIPQDTVCQLLHHRLGQWMIMNWSFYEGSRLAHYLRTAGVTFPDDMADFLILAYHDHLNGRPFSIKDNAVRFRKVRRAAYEEEVKDGKVLEEKVRPRPKPSKP